MYIYMNFTERTTSLNKTFTLLLAFALLSACGEEQNYKQDDFNVLLTELHNPETGNILVAAHRAYHKGHPDNSLEAIEAAIEAGVDIVEIDVRTNSRGTAILAHDKIEKPYGEKISRLDKALLTTKGKIIAMLDIKDISAKQLVKEIHATNAGSGVIVYDQSFEFLDSILLLDSSLIVMPRARSEQDIDSILAHFGKLPVIHVDKSFNTAELAERINKAGARTWTNALGLPDIVAATGLKGPAYTPIIKRGAGIIQTDRPVRLLKYLDKQDKRNFNPSN